jgi:lysylphosphatidylglycerol synthetase-like protein (DUF2156 family)
MEAFANFYTQYQVPVVTPDLMRRRSDAERGLMNLMFIRADEHYREAGCRWC